MNQHQEQKVYITLDKNSLILFNTNIILQVELEYYMALTIC